MFPITPGCPSIPLVQVPCKQLRSLAPAHMVQQLSQMRTGLVGFYWMVLEITITPTVGFKYLDLFLNYLNCPADSLIATSILPYFRPKSAISPTKGAFGGLIRPCTYSFQNSFSVVSNYQCSRHHTPTDLPSHSYTHSQLLVHPIKDISIIKLDKQIRTFQQ